MAQKCIYLSKESEEILKGAENVSNLINNLLSEYFNKKKFGQIDSLKLQINALNFQLTNLENERDISFKNYNLSIEQLKYKTKNLQDELNNLELEEADREKEALKQEELKPHNEAQEVRLLEPYTLDSEKLESLRANQLSAFEKYDVPKDQQEAVFNEFFNLLTAHKIHNLISFMAVKGINKKPTREELEQTKLLTDSKPINL